MKAGNLFLQSEVFTVIDTTPTMRNSALALYDKQPASVSFTDCLVMACADEYKTKLIFGFDSAFRKNGYTRLGLDDQKR
jgi:predicted nucleic acid-binding protein